MIIKLSQKKNIDITLELSESDQEAKRRETAASNSNVETMF